MLFLCDLWVTAEQNSISISTAVDCTGKEHVTMGKDAWAEMNIPTVSLLSLVSIFSPTVAIKERLGGEACISALLMVQCIHLS